MVEANEKQNTDPWWGSGPGRTTSASSRSPKPTTRLRFVPSPCRRLIKQKDSLASDAARDEQVYNSVPSLMADIEYKAKKFGSYDPCIHLDYAAPWQEVIKGYGEKSVKRLRKMFDHREVFTRRATGGG
ncbi:hypothetical protein AAE478_002907 [Parahypoxylon ruwenzoriense]